MTTAAIYARVSGARQKEEQTIGSQVVECKTAAGSWGLDVPEGWVFTDEGYSGASLVRPALERLRDLAAQVPVDVVVCYSPDRLARKLAYQTLLIDELNKAGCEVRFVKARKVETPEDEMLLQFQGMIAEYERALIMERTRRGKAFRARAGVVNVLGGAPYGFCYVRRSDICEARYEVVEDEAQIVREVFRRYTEDQVPIGGLARWLSAEKIPTRTGKDRWDRSVIWAMLKNPAYVGRAAFLKTGSTDKRPAINRQARLQGRSVSRHHAKYDRPKDEWITIAVPAIVNEGTFELAERRLADNRRFSARNSKEPSLLMGLTACQSCGYAYYRTSTRTAKRKILLLPLPWLRRLPLQGGPGLRQQTGARRLPRRSRVGTSHRPVGRSRPRPRRARPTPDRGARRQPRHLRARPARPRPDAHHQGHRPARAGLPGRPAHPRRAACSHA